MSLPPVPVLDTGLIDAHRNAHRQLDDALLSAHPGVARLVCRLSLRLTVSAIANVRPSLRGGRAPQLFPSPRAFLGPTDLARLAGARAAQRHVDSRLAMVTQGYEAPPALRPETPFVLHALAEGPVGNPIETNPGMIRGTEFDGAVISASGRPVPAHEECRQLLEHVVQVASDSEMPAVARAGWIFFALGEVHPFQDGNGRVARLLYLLVAGEAMPRTADWGVLEQVRFHEGLLVEAARLEGAAPTVEVATELSRAGAVLMTDRLGVLGAVLPELARRLGLSFDAALLTVAVWLRRVAPLRELAVDLARPPAEVLATARALEGHRLLVRHLGPHPEPPSDAPAYATAPGLAAELSFLLIAAADPGGAMVVDSKSDMS
jgi:hypothetical protein